MKDLYYFVAVLSIVVIFRVSGTDVTPKNDIEEQILQLFEQWRSGATLPFALPALNVIKVPGLQGNYSGNGLKITYTTSELQVIGLNNFSVIDLNVSESNLEASGVVRIPIASINAEKYNLMGRAYYLFSLTGSGTMNITVLNTEVSFSLRLAYNGTGTKIDEIGLDFKMDSIKVNLENSSWPLNQVLSSEGLSIIERYHDDIVALTRDTLLSKFNEYLATMTHEELFNMIGGGDCNCVEC